MKRTNALTEGAMTAVLFIVLLLIAFYVPLIGYIIIWFLPLPFVAYVLRNQLKPAFTVWAVSLVIALLVASLYGFLLAFVFASGGLVVGELYRRRYSAFGVLLGGSLIYTAGVIIVFIFSVVFLDLNVISSTLQLVEQTIDSAEQMATTLGEDPGNRFASMRQTLDRLHYLAPIFLIFMGVSYALITQLIATPIMKRIGFSQYVQPWIPFREWHFPKSFLWYYLVVLIIGFLQSFTVGSAWFIVYYNLFMILQMAMLIQGVSFIFFFMHLKKVRKGISILVLVAFLFFWALLMPFVRIIGIIDLGFDLRKRLRPS
ncbi:MAG TPA: DUF2232 domain-containing protein [Bacillales bacterium]